MITQGSHFSQSLDPIPFSFPPRMGDSLYAKSAESCDLFVGVFADQSLTYAAHWNLHFKNEDSKTQGWETEASIHTAGEGGVVFRKWI